MRVGRFCMGHHTIEVTIGILRLCLNSKYVCLDVCNCRFCVCIASRACKLVYPKMLTAAAAFFRQHFVNKRPILTDAIHVKQETHNPQG